MNWIIWIFCALVWSIIFSGSYWFMLKNLTWYFFFVRVSCIVSVKGMEGLLCCATETAWLAWRPWESMIIGTRSCTRPWANMKLGSTERWQLLQIRAVRTIRVLKLGLTMSYKCSNNEVVVMCVFNIRCRILNGNLVSTGLILLSIPERNCVSLFRLDEGNFLYAQTSSSQRMIMHLIHFSKLI